jgi:type IX secretion system PorP/SprF family membrane protein
MKMNFLFISSFFISIILYGQDFHFSQFNHSPLNLNPAMTGIYEFGYWGYDVRFAGNYRDQWRTIQSPYVSTATPFKTNSFSTDMKIRSIRFLDRDFIGVGAVFYNDKSGDLDFKTRQVNFSLSYSKRLNYYGDKYLTLGFMGGYSKRSIDYTNAVFDNQWTGTQFDPSKATGESFPGMSYGYKDLSCGVVFSSIPVNKLNFTAGFAIMHFNRPNQSFFVDNSGTNKSYSVVLYPTYVTHANARIPLRYGKLLYPSFLYLRQGPAGEFNFTNYFELQPATIDKMNYQLGIGYRIVGNYQRIAASDAFIAAFKLIYKNLNFTFSYDANTSSLRKATKTIGGFEISLIYYERLFRLKRYKEAQQRPSCPRHDRFRKDIPIW